MLLIIYNDSYIVLGRLSINFSMFVFMTYVKRFFVFVKTTSLLRILSGEIISSTMRLF